jgi:hypothetical protein
MNLVLPPEGKKNWAKIPSGEIVSNEMIRAEFSEVFEREIRAVANGERNFATARLNIGLALNARHFWPTAADEKAETSWLDTILKTNVHLIWGERSR